MVELSNTLQESLQSTNAEMLQQIESLQQSVLDYQRLYNELRAQHREKVMDESNSLLKSRVEDLSQSVTQLQRENAELKSQRSASSGSTGELEERVISLERTVLEYQEKYDALKKSNQDLMRQQWVSRRVARCRRGSRAPRAGKAAPCGNPTRARA